MDDEFAEVEVDEAPKGLSMGHHKLKLHARVLLHQLLVTILRP